MSRVEFNVERFWSRIDRSGGPDACWPWTGARSSENGYGILCFRTIMKVTHRIAYELENGPIPAGALVCHRCDYRPCCNPGHLFLGTYRDNTQDMHRKGRSGRERIKQENRARAAAYVQAAGRPVAAAELGKAIGVRRSASYDILGWLKQEGLLPGPILAAVERSEDPPQT